MSADRATVGAGSKRRSGTRAGGVACGVEGVSLAGGATGGWTCFCGGVRVGVSCPAMGTGVTVIAVSRKTESNKINFLAIVASLEIIEGPEEQGDFASVGCRALPLGWEVSPPPGFARVAHLYGKNRGPLLLGSSPWKKPLSSLGSRTA